MTRDNYNGNRRQNRRAPTRAYNTFDKGGQLLNAVKDQTVPKESASKTTPPSHNAGGHSSIQRISSGSRSQASHQYGRPDSRRSVSHSSSRHVSSHINQRTRRELTTSNDKEERVALPPPDTDIFRIIPLGGVEEVGRNMCVVELHNDIFILDCGFQFTPEADAPGIDYILPNTKYLEDRKDRIKGLIITHGHLDHIGGIPYIMDRIGNPPIYTRYLTSLMIKKRQAEFPHLAEIDIKIVEPGSRIKIAETYVSFFAVTHSIPDSMGVIIETKHGNAVFSGDLKLDRINNEPTDVEKERWGTIGKQKNILFVGDSTNTERPGFSITEREIHETLEDIIKNAKNRLIIGTFASQFERMIKIIEIADKYNKKIITDGRSIKTNIEIAKEGKILNIKEDTIVPVEDIDKYPPDRIIVLATGAQGEEFAVLMRVATKRHKQITLNERDTIVLSSSVIPGNEMNVQKLKDNLYRHNVRIIHYRVSDVHSTGHGYAGELVWINKQVKAKFFMPAYGFRSMLSCHAQAVVDAGFPKGNIVIPDNGTIIEIENGETMRIRKEKAPSNPLMVDGFSIGDRQEVVIRDRQALSKDGMFVIIASLNGRTGKLRKSPDIISRGFVYLRESQELLNQTRLIIKKTI
ncbi:MAG: ribonuclease J, partial [bacterium]|nr:ribonuclease J [bacterium]